MATTGFQSGLVEAVYPFQGLYEAHLMAWDPSVPEWAPRYILPEVVTRHYGECQIICDTPGRVEHYKDYLKDAVRVNVMLATDHNEQIQEHIQKMKQELIPDDPSVLLQAPKEEIQQLERMNLALHESMVHRKSVKYHLPPVEQESP